MSTLLKLDELLVPAKAVVLLLNSPPALHPQCWLQVWERGSIRCATDGAANFLAKFCQDGTKTPDLITGDFDSITAASRQYFSDRGVEICETQDQDSTDMSKLLGEVDRRGFLDSKKSVLVLGGMGGRFDHTLSSINSLICTDIKKPIFLLDQENLVTVLGSGKHQIEFGTSKRLFPGTCGLMPIVQRETRVTTTGLHWNLADSQMGFGQLISSSNRLELDQNGGKLDVETTEPVILSLHADWSAF